MKFILKPFVFIFSLMLFNYKVTGCVDVTVDINIKESTYKFTVEAIGPAYGGLQTNMYKMRPGFKCYKVVRGIGVLWKARGPERVFQLLVSGHGGRKKVIELQLDNGRTIFFKKNGAFSPWQVSESNS